MKKRLGIIFFESTDIELGTYLIKKFQEIFSDRFTSYELIKEPIEIPKKSYAKDRDQYFASFLLEPLRIYAIDNEFYKILGIFQNDIYSKWFNFVLGQAEFGDEEETRASLISVIRLKIDINYEKDDINQYHERVLKEGLHEIGHTLNLDHCDNNCVMNFSETLSHADKKPYKYCPSCEKKLKLNK